jgi:uncharacterized repeat protein (TIGR01451 family)
MKCYSLSQIARALALVLLIGVVAALAASNAAWAGPSPQAQPPRQPPRSTVPRRGTDLVITQTYRRVWWGGVTFTLTVTNTGPIAAQDVLVTDSISRRMQLEQATTTKGLCQGDPVVRCQLGDLAASEMVTVTVQATIWLDEFWLERYRGPIRNTASVSSQTRDTKPSNNSATVILNRRTGVFPWFDQYRPGPDEIGSSDD